MSLWNKLIGSLDNKENGASGKKLTAMFASVFCLIIPIDAWTLWAFMNNDWSQLPWIIATVTTFIAALFGINAVEKKIIQDKVESNEQ